jgi:tetratricopeptide (TPR) repeat protein
MTLSFEELARQTAQDLFDGTAVIFLGAGASVGDDSERAVGKGVAGSGTLTKAIAKRFGIELKYDSDGNLLSPLRPVASLAAKRRDQSTVKRYVIDQIRPQCGVVLKAHRALASVNPHTVITTNYDDLYETAAREAGHPLEKVVRPEQLPRLPQDRPRLLKLHGDLETPEEIVLTRVDYRKWQREAGGFKAKVVATLQESVCIFVGYGVGDENLHDILNIIEDNLGGSSLKHFALVHEVDDALAAEWEGTVEFVSGDATQFFELVAEEHRALGPAPFNPILARTDFERQLSSGDLSDAGETCEELAEYLEARGERAGAGSLWRAFGEAAREAEEHASAAAALKRAGELFLEAGYDLDAEPVLSAARNEAEAAGAPELARDIQPLLQKARLSVGRYGDVLRDTDRVLDSYGQDAPASLVYALRVARAEAREATEGIAAAREELKAALGELPADALYFRVRTGVDLARLFADEFNWDAAHDVLNGVGVEISNSDGQVDRHELRRCAAIQKLARGNVHFAVGEDDFASMHYRECAPVLEELGETGFAVSALQGAVACAPFLGYLAGAETTARLRDLARASDEHRRCTDLQRMGIEYLAENQLAAARNSLVRADAAANALHSPTRPRSIRGWLADVLLDAGFARDALVQYAEVGDRKKVEQVADDLRWEAPPGNEDSQPAVGHLLELAKKGPLHSRGPAFVGLKRLWDMIPDEHLSEITDQLAGLPDMPNIGWADRNVLPDAAGLAQVLAPRFSGEQAEIVGAAVVATINTDDVPWTSHKAACQALVALVARRPTLLDELEVPVDRLVELAVGDVLNDTVRALMALVNLGLSGHAESKQKALELLEDADTYTRVSWRQVLDETTEEELESAIRQLLPQSVSRVQVQENTQSVGMGLFNPLFLEKWGLSSAVTSEVADTLSEAVADPMAVLTHRRAAALALGRKASEFGAEERNKIIQTLKEVLTRPFEAHPMVRSTDNPLSMLRMNVGQNDDVIAAVAWALLTYSPWIEDKDDRRLLQRELERLRASQVEELGIGVAAGLRSFKPRGSEEERWLTTRLLLLLNSQHPEVRQGAAYSLAELVERGVLPFDAELLDTVLHLSAADHVEDRKAAARALAAMSTGAEWYRARIGEAVKKLRDDTSYLVRIQTEVEA